MENIKVKILNHNFDGTGLFLAKMTQRGHQINNLDDLLKLYEENVNKQPSKEFLNLPHTTLVRMNEMTIAIYGLSTKAVSQFRTHAKHFTFMSTSTQYSEYRNTDNLFVIPEGLNNEQREQYINACKNIHKQYMLLISSGVNKDDASYLLPQSLRKCLIIHGSFDDWRYMLQLRTCNRNTREVQYICELILNEVAKECGPNWANLCLPKCVNGKCEEGKMSCGHKYISKINEEIEK